MKKIIAIIVAMLPLVTFAQSFTLTPNGLVNAEDTTKHFVVVEVPGTKSELFAKAKTAVTAMWNSPKDVMSCNEPDIITVNGYNGDAIYRKLLGAKYYFSFNYRLQLQFKDGKIRIDAPVVDKAELQNNKGTLYFCCGKDSFSGSAYVFNKEGKVKYKDQKKQLEDYLNGLIATLVDKIKNGASNEDW